MARIRALRRELKLSQAQFAKLINVHQTAVSQWETGRTAPDLNTLRLIARVTGRSMDYIMEWDARERAQAAEYAPIAPERAPDDFDMILKMPDDGMLGARVRKGDDVFICARARVPDGAIAAVERAEGVLIRYLFRLPDALLLLPASPEYAKATAPLTARVLGRAVGFRSAL